MAHGTPPFSADAALRLPSACFFDFGHYRWRIDFRLCLIACSGNVI
jgi:hypothetical protein